MSAEDGGQATTQMGKPGGDGGIVVAEKETPWEDGSVAARMRRSGKGE